MRFHHVALAVSSVHRTLMRHGLNRLPASQKHRAHVKRWQQYEKPQPGHRLQIDVKFLERIVVERGDVGVISNMELGTVHAARFGLCRVPSSGTSVTLKDDSRASPHQWPRQREHGLPRATAPAADSVAEAGAAVSLGQPPGTCLLGTTASSQAFVEVK